MRDASKIYSKYITEALSKDYTHAMTRFDSIVKDFRACKTVDGTSLSLLSELLMYIAKFVEEHTIDNNVSGLKTAKDQIRKASDALDNVAEKMRKGDSNDMKLGDDTKSMSPVDDTDAEDTSTDADTNTDMDTADNKDTDDANTLPNDSEDNKDMGTETDVPPKGALDSEPVKKQPSKLASKLGGDDFEPIPPR